MQPTGWTPLGTAIKDSAGDIPEDATDSIVYVVTDGLETCGGDPVKAAEAVANQGMRPIVNVIGFQVGDADQAALEAIAAAGGGSYTSADSAASLEAYLDAERQRMITAWADWKKAEVARLNTVLKEKSAQNNTAGTNLSVGLLQDQTHVHLTVGQLNGEGSVDWNAVDDLAAGYFEERWDLVTGLQTSNSDALNSGFFSGIDEVYATTDTTWTELYAEQDQR